LLWKVEWRLLKKLKVKLPYDPAIPLLSIYPKYVSQDTINLLAHLCLLALFTIAKLWKQPRCSATDEWIKKM
jgi:hypothetical protein